MFQFSGLPTLYYFIHITLHSLYSVWVPPFGNLRIYTYLPFPAAYRSLSRPSSAPDAKASSLCSCSLDPFFSVLLSYLENYMSIKSVKKIYLFNPYEIVFTLFGKTFFIVSLFSLLILLIVQFSMCNRWLFRQPWWRWGESNSWPPACKAGALPTELHPQSEITTNF